MFQQRQIAEVNPLVEISFCTVSPGAVGSGATVGANGVCVLGGASGTQPATFALGDQLEVFPSAATACNGINVSAAPTATQGTARLNFSNYTGGSITPVSGTYTIIATRIPPNLVS